MWNGICRNKKLVKCGNTIIDCSGSRYITEWINPTAYASYQVVKECIPIAKQFQQQYSIYNFPLEHCLIYAIWGWVNKNISYKYDEKYPDYWNDVGETYEDKWGDCEDSSILCQSAIECALRDRAKTKLAIGYYISDNWYGHAWCYYDSIVFKKKVVLECTFDDYIPPNTYIEGLKYHPTIICNSKEWQITCTCDKCKIMLEYLSGNITREKVNWKRDVKIELKEWRPSLFEKIKLKFLKVIHK